MPENVALPLSLYVHLPWCLSKCPYCDFNSHAWRGSLRELPEARYLDALQADLEASLPKVRGRSVSTVFIGGGTPSLFSPDAIERLLATIRARLRVAPGAEVTMEANPGTFEAQRFAAYAQAGVTRLSIGVQSFSDDALRALGRVHDARQARAAIEEAARSFASFNIDLMYALPGQTLQGLRDDLASALAFGPPHLSLYHLTIEPGTAFAKRPPPLPDDDLSADMLALAGDTLGAAGFERYEVSAWARPGARCRHNLNYWEFGDYLGIGAGAHGKLTFHDRIVREARVRQPERYVDAALAASAIGEERIVSCDELPFEFMLNALRLTEGVPAAWFSERTGQSVAAIGRERARAVERGLLEADPTRIRATPLGLRFLNDLLGLFLKNDDRR
ncbi:MAG: radical SAM family heme chaperone HemW [Burkholderiales bacterium]|jgi:oxygen-independent coproporphyrinogen-3 oxidase|nr:radical SAM family heme chaperone HemW [Burkholderiales bacterium]HMM51738.1 radical SAM family heme chaperone HemW [Burkholderiaceae bacterium]